MKAYGEWQVSNVGDDIFKVALLHTCDVILEHGLALEQVCLHREKNQSVSRLHKEMSRDNLTPVFSEDHMMISFVVM